MGRYSRSGFAECDFTLAFRESPFAGEFGLVASECPRRFERFQKNDPRGLKWLKSFRAGHLDVTEFAAGIEVAKVMRLAIGARPRQTRAENETPKETRDLASQALVNPQLESRKDR